MGHRTLSLCFLLGVVLAPLNSTMAGENPNAKLCMHLVASTQYLYFDDFAPMVEGNIDQDLSVEELAAAGYYVYCVLCAYDFAGIAAMEFRLDGWPSARGCPYTPTLEWEPDDTGGQTLCLGDQWADGGICSWGLWGGACDPQNPHLRTRDCGGYQCQIYPFAYFWTDVYASYCLPINLNYAPSSFSYSTDPHIYVLDCTVQYLEDVIDPQNTYGCVIGGEWTGDRPFPEVGCSVVPTALSFETQSVGGTDSESFTITNTGLATLSGTVTESCPEFEVTPTAYSLPPSTSETFTVTFTCPGEGSGSCTLDTGIACDDVTCTWTCTAGCQEIPLSGGWNCVSSYMVPTDSHMEAVWADVIAAGHLNIVKNDCSGEFCIPGVLCNMDWDPYSCSMAHLSAPDVLSVCGTAVAEEGPVSLETGWNCVPFFPRQPQAPQAALASCWDHVNLVKSNCTGEFCIPGVICNITAMNPGECYMAHMAEACDFYYPPSPGPMVRETARVEVLEPEHFASVKWTGATYSIVVEDPERILSRGDEVGVFHGGLCVGTGVWTGGPVLGVTVWGDDASTEIIDGCVDGDVLDYRVWDTRASEEYVLEMEYIAGSGAYGSGPYSLVAIRGVLTGADAETSVVVADHLSQNRPNPFNPETVISYGLSRPGHVTLAVFDVQGQQVRVLVDHAEPAGRHQVRWDGRDDSGRELGPGIYFYRLQAGHLQMMKKMVLLK